VGTDSQRQIWGEMTINLSLYFKIAFCVLTFLWYWSVRIATFNTEYGHRLFEEFCRQVFINLTKGGSLMIEEVKKILNSEPIKMYPSIEDAKRAILQRNEELAKQICQLIEEAKREEGF